MAQRFVPQPAATARHPRDLDDGKLGAGREALPAG
jgi:hypothetical protein